MNTFSELSRSQGRALLLLKEHERLPVTVRESGINIQTADNLHARGLVKFVMHYQNNYRNEVILSDFGRQVAGLLELELQSINA